MKFLIFKICSGTHCIRAYLLDKIRPPFIVECIRFLGPAFYCIVRRICTFHFFWLWPMCWAPFLLEPCSPRWKVSLDITRVGSGNIGATNVMRQAGPALGIATLACDMAKGALPVLGAVLVLGTETFFAQAGVALVALAAVFGAFVPVIFPF